MFLCVLGVASVASAAPLDVKHVPADAAAVVHVDAEALRRTSFYKPMRAELDHAKLELSLNAIVTPLLDSCKSTTFWVLDSKGSSKKEDAPKAILVTMPGSKEASELVDAIAKRTHAKKVGGHYVGKADRDDLHMTAIAEIIVLSDRADALAKAVDVLQGKAPSLTEKSVPGGAPPGGVFLFVALGSSLLDDVKKSTDSTLLKTDITSLVVSVAEAGTDLRASATAAMTNADDAEKVKKIVEGLVAMAALSDTLRPFQVDRHVKVKVAGTSVEVQLSFPSAELIKLIEGAGTSSP
jgi:hypothetical protein